MGEGWQSVSAGGDSFVQAVTPDGRYVVFGSSARNLLRMPSGGPLPESAAPCVNVYVRDLSSNVTQLVSAAYAGQGGADSDALPIAISQDGRYVLFESSAGNLMPGDFNGQSDVFLRDVEAGFTKCVSASTSGRAGNGSSHSPQMTPDARFVAFVSRANNLVSGDANQIADVFIRDMLSNRTELVSVGAQGSGTIGCGSDHPLISIDGRYVAFSSTASNLVADPVPIVSGETRYRDVYVRDLKTSTTSWASRDARTVVAQALGGTNAFSFNHQLSDEGRFVVFESTPGGGAPGVILCFETPTGTTRTVNTNAVVTSGPFEQASTLAITPDGRLVAFAAVAEPPLTNTTWRKIVERGVGNLNCREHELGRRR